MLQAVVALIFVVVAVLAAIAQLMSDDLRSNPWLKWGIVGTLSALTLYAIFGSVVSWQSASDDDELGGTASVGTTVPIAVDATKDWQPSGVIVRRGDNVSIRVVGGTWTARRMAFDDKYRQSINEEWRNAQIWVNNSIDNNGEGSPGSTCLENLDRNCPLPYENVGALIARIGVNSPFLIGNASTFTASTGGQIYLRMNDGRSEGTEFLTDNAGVLAVEILVSP